MDRDCNKYYYKYKDGAPTGMVRKTLPAGGARIPMNAWYGTWEELAGVIGDRPRLDADDQPVLDDSGEPVRGLGLHDELVKHIFFKFRRRHKADPDPNAPAKVRRSSVMAGLSHLLMAGYGPRHKLMLAFELATPAAIPSEVDELDRNKLPGPSDCLNKKQFEHMYRSLHEWCVKFPLRLPRDKTCRVRPLSKNKQVAQARRMFDSINFNSDNHLITYQMLAEYAHKHPREFHSVLGIHIGQEDLYEIDPTNRFLLHTNDDVATLVQVLDALGAWQQNLSLIHI
eukprot:TRINITY_DN19393_c0_g1_i3.p1 TRINITY_DN19393_c0_g1~~TRINITY_DN19393_c0_g1_i3.p1  ORF type:complete len:284 (-),score=60.53 TRINITY_DN19393_c0_g1_i3:128-979(-)